MQGAFKGLFSQKCTIGSGIFFNIDDYSSNLQSTLENLIAFLNISGIYLIAVCLQRRKAKSKQEKKNTFKKVE